MGGMTAGEALTALRGQQRPRRGAACGLLLREPQLSADADVVLAAAERDSGALLDAAPCKLTPKNNQLKLSLTYEQVSALRIAILEELGWVHWAQYKRAWAIVANPRDYALF